MYDIIIVGAGPSGMTAALYGRRANKKVLVLEALTYGGQIINTTNIENYPAEDEDDMIGATKEDFIKAAEGQSLTCK